MIGFPKILISGSYNAFNEGWNGCGVYMASGLYVSQTFKLPIYIGSAKNLQTRIEKGHIQNLELNNHPHNKPLQIAWNNHKEEGFVWWLLETCSIEERFIREQFYFDTIRPFVDEFGGFNINKSAKGCETEYTVERRLKLSNSQKGENHFNYGNSYTDDHKQKLSDAHSHQDNASLKKSYKFISPEGELVKVFGLNEFCREHNLDRPGMIGVNRGDHGHHRGWRSPKTEFINEPLKHREHYLINGSGEIIYINNLRQFCLKNKFTYLLMLNFVNGKTKGYLDWKIASPEQISEYQSRIKE